MVELIEYKSKSLLYPILMCSIINFFLTTGVVSVLTKEYGTLLGGMTITSLWFLWSLLSCCITLALVIKLPKNPMIQVLMLICGILFVALFPNSSMNLYMYPYFVSGYYYARTEDKLRNVRSVGGIISTVIFIIMMFFYEKKHYIYISGFLGGETRLDSVCIDFFRWAVGLFGSVTVVWICWILYGVIRKRKIITIIENLGKDSLAVYALSVSLLSYWLPKICKIILNVLTWVDWNSCIWFYNLIFTPLVAVAYSLLFLLIIKGLKKYNAYRLIFGR